MKTPKLRARLNALTDAGVRAGVEAAICARADLLLSTASPCDNCERARRCAKLSSAFGSHMVARRTAYGQPTEALF